MYENQNYNTVLTRMTNKVSGVDTREGSVIFNALAPAALELSTIYGLLQRILTETYADTASREFLILRAAERGITPNAATFAEVKAVISGSGLDSNDVIGSTFSCDPVYYTAIKAVEGENDTYVLRCQTAGTEGNILSGYLTNDDNLPYVERAQIVGIVNFAEDEEETEAFRARYMESIQSTPFAGNISAYKEIMEAFEEVGGAKVIPAWVLGSENGDVEIIVISAGTEELTPEQIENLQQKICPGDFTYTISGTWKAGDSFTVGNEKYTCYSSSSTYSDENGFSTNTSSNGIAKIIAKNAYNATVESGSFTCKTNYRIGQINVSGSTGKVIKTCKLNGGTGTGLAPIGHNVQITPAVGRLVVVNFDTTAADYGYMTQGSIAEIRGALEETTLKFAQRWEEFDSSMPLYLSWYISALQQLTGFIAVAGLRFYIQGRDPEGDQIILERHEYPYFYPKNDDLRSMISTCKLKSLSSTIGENLLDIASYWESKLKIKVLRNDGGTGVYTVIPYLEIPERIIFTSLVKIIEDGAETKTHRFEWTQKGYRTINLQLINDIDDDYFKDGQRNNGTGVLSLSLSGKCRQIESNSTPLSVSPFLIENGSNEDGGSEKYSIINLGGSIPEDCKKSTIRLKYYLKSGTYMESVVGDPYESELELWNLIKPVIEQFDEEFRENWYAIDDPDQAIIFDLNELGDRLKAATGLATYERRIAFDSSMKSEKYITLDLEAKTATLDPRAVPVISVTIYHEDANEQEKDTYKNAYVW